MSRTILIRILNLFDKEELYCHSNIVFYTMFITEFYGAIKGQYNTIFQSFFFFSRKINKDFRIFLIFVKNFTNF